jgi:hypothetical protein
VHQQQEWAGNFLLNNLNNSKGSESSGGPNGRSGRSSLPSAIPSASAKNFYGMQDKDFKDSNKMESVSRLPPLVGSCRVEASQGQEGSSLQNSRASSRYLRMARYQPGLQQAPMASAANAQTGKRDYLPSFGVQRGT